MIADKKKKGQQVFCTQGSSLTFSAPGGWGKEKRKQARRKNLPPKAMARRKGGVGGIPPRPSRSEAPPPRAVEREAEQKNFLFLFRRIFWRRAQIRNCKESFSARQAAALRRLAAGRSDWFQSEIFAKIGSSVVV